MNIREAVAAFLVFHGVHALTDEQWDSFVEFLSSAELIQRHKLESIKMLRSFTAVTKEVNIDAPYNLFSTFLSTQGIDRVRAMQGKMLGLRESKDLVEWLLKNIDML